MPMNVLISGAGIAGPTLAYWLAHYGNVPTIIEKAPELRTGGYIIDFWGSGFDVAEKMNLLPVLLDKGYMVREVRVVNRDGTRISGFPAKIFADLTNGRFTSLPRGDLAASIFHTIDGSVETIFGDSIRGIEQSATGVHVSFQRHPARTFDLVVGADGLHSRVRELVFGSEERYERYLGYKVAAFEVSGYRPRDELVYVMYTEVGQQIARFAMRNDRTLFLLSYVDDNASISGDIQEEKKQLRMRFGHSGWESSKILDAVDASTEVYFDRVSQIRIDPFEGGCTRNRVALLGDAGWCPSLLAGEGSGLAMTGAYILAEELHRAANDHVAAFARYRKRFEPFVFKKQQAARRFAATITPKSRQSIFLRNQVFRLLSIPWMARAVAGRGMMEKIPMPVT